MERDYRLLGRVFIAGFCLGLLVASGCFGAYLIWGPAVRESRAERELRESQERADQLVRRILLDTEADLREAEDADQERRRVRDELLRRAEELNKLVEEGREAGKPPDDK